jgi:N-hydroxyarylamine O-acetyltransferase
MEALRYLERIGLPTFPDVTPDGLARLHRAHRLAIPFENLVIRQGLSISLDPPAIFDKLITRRRGGYCFEQNALFGWALCKAQFDWRPLLSRIWTGHCTGDPVPARTHTLLLVTIDGALWIADAGFGRGYAPPMPLVNGAMVTGEDGAVHRLVKDAAYGWMLERQGSSGFAPEYSFTLDAAQPLDLEMSNHWTASWPQSRHVVNAIASIVETNGLASIFNREFSRQTMGVRTAREISGPEELHDLLNSVFGIALTLAEVRALGLF